MSLTPSRGVTILLGRNGAGKSTLCRILVGLERPSDGGVVRGGQSLMSRTDWQTHHASTGWLPQQLSVPSSMTVTQYVTYAAWLKGSNGRNLRAQVERALERTDLIEQRGQLLRQLSGGMLRRAGIAQAVVHEPDLLVLDEPTVGLDPEQRAWFHQQINELAQKRSVLLSTHLLEDVEAVGDRVVVLDEGRICFDDCTRRLRAIGGGSSAGSPSEELRQGFLTVIREKTIG